MKRFFKITALILALLTVISCFAACGGASNDTTSPTQSGVNGNTDQYGREYIEDSIPDGLRFDDETVFSALDGDIAQIYEANKVKYENPLEELINKLDEMSFMS